MRINKDDGMLRKRKAGMIRTIKIYFDFTTVKGFLMINSDSVSYWQRTTPHLPLATTLPPSVDVTVIGGGLLGASTCYWLARSGIRVALLERTAIAHGATGRNGGFVRAGSAESYPEAIAHLGRETARAMMDITTESRTLLRQVVREEDIACDYREPGTLQLAITEVQAEQQQQEVEALHVDGFAATWFDRAQVHAMIKTPLGSEILGGRFLPEQGLVHSARLVHGLIQAALRYGAHAYQTKVSQIDREGSHVLLHTSGGLLSAGKVVIAINAWTSQLLPELTNVIMPVREQMLAYEPIALAFSPGISIDLVAGEYMQQTPSGVILIGGCGSVAPNADIGVMASQPIAEVQEAIESILPRIFPSLVPQLHVKQRWAGLLGYTTDMHPLVDQVPAIPEAFFVGGFSGHGMPFGMRIGQLLATAVISRSLPSVLTPFRLDRPSLKRWDLS
jgi:glycine/D-amino acid oxidase-like deaminating enzyme